MSVQAQRWSARCAVTALLCGFATTPAAAEWKRIDSPNFVVMGDVSAKQLRDVVIQFEGFRETLSRVLNQRATATAVPTVVFVFPSDRAFTPFKTRFNGKPVELSGLFLPRSDINYIGIVAGGESQGLRIMFHEYAHLIISNVSHNVPVWLNEGLAEYYSTYETARDGREVRLGLPIESHLRRLNDTRLLSLDELIKVGHDSPLYNEGERRSVFYAQSWALTHLILLGKPPRLQQLSDFLNGLDRGQSEDAAWQAAFGPDMEKALRDYIRQRAFNYYNPTFSEKLTTFDAAAMPMAEADVQAFLGDFLTRQQRYDEATERLSAAAALDARNARVRVARARLALDKGDFDGAQKLLLDSSDVQDWLVSYASGVSLVEILERQGTTADTAYLTAARQNFDAVIAARGDVPNALARRASLELRTGVEPSDKTVLLIAKARALAPGRSDYAFIHAEILARRGQFAEARNVLGPLLPGSTPASIREPAVRLMTYIVQLEQSRQARAARATPTAASDATQPAGADTPPESKPGSPPDTGEPPARTTAAIFRITQSGEQRLEGKLDRIDCSGASATFHVQTTNGPVVVRAPKLVDVDFISYRDDLSGNVKCGPLKEPMAVYVTWKEGAGAQAGKQVVAVEFLPK